MSISVKTVVATYNVAQEVAELMVDFKRERCEQKIAELEALIARLDNHKKNLESLKNRIPTFWEDEKANTVIAALTRTMNDVDKKMLVSKDLVETYKIAMNAMETSESSATNLLEDALGLLESVLE